MVACLPLVQQVRVRSPASLIFQTLLRFTYVTAHSPILTSLHLSHSSFSNPYIASPTSQLILQHFRCFTYVTAHSPTLPLLHLHHSSIFNPSVASPTSQLILQSFFRLSYVTGFSPPSPGEPPMAATCGYTNCSNMSKYMGPVTVGSQKKNGPMIVSFISTAGHKQRIKPEPN